MHTVIVSGASLQWSLSDIEQVTLLGRQPDTDELRLHQSLEDQLPSYKFS